MEMRLAPLVLACAACAVGDVSEPLPALVVEVQEPVGDGAGRFPDLLVDPAHGGHLIWLEELAGGGADLRHTARLDGSGQSRTLVSSPDLFVNWADFPTLAALPDGTLAAAWLTRRSVLPGYGIDVALSRDGGETFGEPFALHDDFRGGEHGFVSIAALDERTFLAIWLDGRLAAGHDHGGGGHDHGGPYQLRARRIDRDGGLGPEVVVDDDVCSCCQTDLEPQPDGSLLAVYRDRSAEDVRDVSYARFSDGRWSAPGNVHPDGWVIPGCPVNGPRAAGRAVAWYTGVGEAGGEVRLRFLGPDAGPPLDVDDGHPLGRVDVQAFDDRTWVVTWLENVGEGEAEWRARLVSSDGEVGPSSVIARVSASRAVGFLRAQVMRGELLATWSEADGGVRLARLTRPR